MVTLKRIPLPNYPSILLSAALLNTDEQKRECFDALAIHYKLNSPVGGFFDQKISNEEMSERWESLALHLILDFIPAFRGRRKGGAPKQPHTQESHAYPHAHKARLVQIVSALKLMRKTDGMSATNMDAYGALIGILKRNPAPNWKYGKIRSKLSFVQAWKAIPKSVRSEPEKFLPPSRNRDEPAKDGRLNGAINWFAATEADWVWQALPPIPTSLHGNLT
jgi:hypothetical protein